MQKNIFNNGFIRDLLRFAMGFIEITIFCILMFYWLKVLEEIIICQSGINEMFKFRICYIIDFIWNYQFN